ncbi:hypothetical protein MPER_12669 [Moniliophthora perniciosa FA553]|nr:hypothetical protein MPER_12669 [Moniliophthora perniciosa FA553]
MVSPNLFHPLTAHNAEFTYRHDRPLRCIGTYYTLPGNNISENGYRLVLAGGICWMARRIVDLRPRHVDHRDTKGTISAFKFIPAGSNPIYIERVMLLFCTRHIPTIKYP